MLKLFQNIKIKLYIKYKESLIIIIIIIIIITRSINLHIKSHLRGRSQQLNARVSTLIKLRFVGGYGPRAKKNKKTIINALKDIAAFNCLGIIKENISRDINKKQKKKS